MWVRAVWQEGDIEEEGVVPESWVAGKKMYWPPGHNALKAIKTKQSPADNWKIFDLVKIKMKTANYSEATNYDYTTSVETEEESEVEVTKRRPKARQFEDYVTGKVLETNLLKTKQVKAQQGKNPIDDSQVRLPEPPSKIQPLARESQQSEPAVPCSSVESSASRKARSTSPGDVPSISQLLADDSQRSSFFRSDKSRSPSDKWSRSPSPTLFTEEASTSRKSLTRKETANPFSSTPLRSPSVEIAETYRSRSREGHTSNVTNNSVSKSHDRFHSSLGKGSRSHDQSANRSKSRERRSVSSERYYLEGHNESSRNRSQWRSRSRDQSVRRSRSRSIIMSERSQTLYRSHSQRSRSRNRSNRRSRSNSSIRSQNLYKSFGQDHSQRSRFHNRSNRSRSRSSHRSNRSQTMFCQDDSQRSHSSSQLNERPHKSHARGSVKKSAFDKAAGISQDLEDGAFPMSTAKFQKRVLYLLVDIRKAVMQDKYMSNEEYKIFRAETLDEFSQLDGYAKKPEERKAMVDMLSKVGGTGIRDNVKRIMGKLMTNELMAKFNMKGGKEKMAFRSTALIGVIIASALKTPGNQNFSEVDISSAIGHCLKYAPDRRGGGGRKSILS